MRSPRYFTGCRAERCVKTSSAWRRCQQYDPRLVGLAATLSYALLGVGKPTGALIIASGALPAVLAGLLGAWLTTGQGPGEEPAAPGSDAKEPA